MADLFVFVLIVGVVVAGGITLGMIVATRVDRIQNPVQKPVQNPVETPRDADPEARASEEQHP